MLNLLAHVLLWVLSLSNGTIFSEQLLYLKNTFLGKKMVQLSLRNLCMLKPTYNFTDAHIYVSYYFHFIFLSWFNSFHIIASCHGIIWKEQCNNICLSHKSHIMPAVFTHEIGLGMCPVSEWDFQYQTRKRVGTRQLEGHT